MLPQQYQHSPRSATICQLDADLAAEALGCHVVQLRAVPPVGHAVDEHSAWAGSAEGEVNGHPAQRLRTVAVFHGKEASDAGDGVHSDQNVSVVRHQPGDLAGDHLAELGHGGGLRRRCRDGMTDRVERRGHRPSVAHRPPKI